MPVSLPWLKTRVRPLTICPRHKERSITTLPSALPGDRKSTRLNSSHSQISYAVFCLKKKNSLPNFDALSALTIAIEKSPDTPFILVSGPVCAQTAVDLLKKGTTDYVVKHRLFQFPIV